jgi:hypothetical protein
MKNEMPSMLRHLSDKDLIARINGLTAREREATAQIVVHLAELDTRDVHLREGYASLFVYCRDALGFSDSEAFNRIEVARAGRRFPLIRRAVWVRDLGRCAFVGSTGHRCNERRFVEFHHVDPHALGGEASVDLIALRCRAHNDYEGSVYFGKKKRAPSDGSARVGEAGVAYRSRSAIARTAG